MSTVRKQILPFVLAVFFILGCDKSTNPVQPTSSGPLRVLLSGPTYHLTIQNDTLQYQAFVMNTDSTAATNGTPVRWLVTGHGQWVNPISYVENGVASNRYAVGTGAGVDTLIVLAGTTPNTAMTTISLIVQPSNLSSIYVLMTGPTHHAAVTTDTLDYQAYVMNGDSTAIRNGTPVRWLVSGHGQWLHPISYTTNGFATNRYVLSIQTGVDTLFAIAGVSPNLAIGTLPLQLQNTTTYMSTRIRQNPPIMFSTGLDSFEVDVVLRGADNVGVANTLLAFSCAHGVIQAYATTDVGGSVVVYMKDGGDTTGARGTYLYVRCESMNLVDSVWYAILPKLTLERIVLNGPNEHVAMPSDTVSFTAILFLTGGNYAYDSSRVYWSSFRRDRTSYSNGIGAFESPITRVVNGASNNLFIMRTGVGFDSLVAMSFTPGHNDTVKTYINFEHVPGPAVRLLLYPQTALLTVNGFPDTVYAIVKDTAGNFVPHSPIQWGCTNGAGRIEPNGYTVIGDTAYALLFANSQSGLFRYWATTVTGVSDTAMFNVNGSNPQSMTLSADQTAIMAQGTGGIEHSTINAIVRDANGNLVAGGIGVQFWITNSLFFDDTSHNVNARPYFNVPGGDSITALTSSNGEASTILSSGYRTGTVQIMAWVLDANGARTGITATSSSVHIYGGAPTSITLTVNSANGEQIGSGIWSIGLSAYLRDANGNPAQDGFAVSFRVSPNIAQTGVDTSTSHNGLATNRMYYSGQNTFDTVRVSVSCISRVNNNPIILSDSINQFALPLEQGALQLNVSPNTFLFSRFPTSATDVNVATHMLWATVRDGYGQSIHGCPVLFSVLRGKLYRTSAEASNRVYTATYRASDNSQNFPPNLLNVYWPVNKRKTGNYTNANAFYNYTDPNGNGTATLYIGVLGPCYNYNSGNPVGEVFLDPQTAEVTSGASATIEGYPSIPAAQVVINYQRS